MMASQVPGMISGVLLAAGNWGWEEDIAFNANLCGMNIVWWGGDSLMSRWLCLLVLDGVGRLQRW
jgi:hypothetical protein